MNSIEKALERQKAKEREAQQKALEEAEKSAPTNTIERAEAVKPSKKQEVQSANASDKPVDELRQEPQRTNVKTQPSSNASTNPMFELDLDALEQKGHVSLQGTRKQVNEEYREIKRKLLKNAFGAIASTLNNPNIIMVTSARPSEGKTFTAVNLALSIALEQDKTVLLVDADVLKPNVLRTLGLEARAGILDYLKGDKEDIADVLYPTNVDKLKIIPAGRSHYLSTELLASAKMHDTIDEFASRYSDRVVIIDTPPLIGINESAILANFAGQAVVVVEEGKSKLREIELAVGRLNPEMAVGFVVNKSINSDSDSTGYYGYYYYASEGENDN